MPADAAADAAEPPTVKLLVRALRMRHDALVACHRAARFPGGRIDLVVVVGEDHSIANVTVARANVPAALGRCIADRVRAVQEPGLAAGTYEIPFWLHAQNPYDGPAVSYGPGGGDPGY